MNKSPLYLILLLGSFIFLFSECGKDSPTPADARASFLGRWSVTETKKNQTYDVEITADMNSTNGVLIYKFVNFGSSIAAGASVNGNTITLDADQEIVSGIIINGYGTLSNTKINWNYTINDGADIIPVTAIYTKI